MGCKVIKISKRFYYFFFKKFFRKIFTIGRFDIQFSKTYPFFPYLCTSFFGVALVVQRIEWKFPKL